MALNDVIQINAQIGNRPIGLANFGTPFVASVLTSPQGAAWTAEYGSDRVIELTPSNWQTQMAALTVASSDDLYRALQRLFGQTLQPSSVLVGRRATRVAQVSTVTVPASPGSGNYTITVNGNDYTASGTGLTQTQLRDALIAAVDGGTDPVEAAIGTSSTLTVTAEDPGLPFTIAVSNVTGAALSVATGTPAVGLADDLVAFLAERSDWWGMMDVSHVDADALAIADQIATVRKAYLGLTSDSDAQTSATTDVGNVLRLAGHQRVAMLYHDDAEAFPDAALLGLMSPQNPGFATWSNKVLQGITGIEPTSVAQLETKNYGWIELYSAKGVSATRNVRMANGDPLDLLLGLDFWVDLLQSYMLTLELNAPKVPYTEKGRQMIESALRAGSLIAASDDYAIIDASTLVVSVPAAASVGDTDRADRVWPGIVVAAKAQGSAEKLQINLTLSIA